eukprot:7928320-Alexandrium_andersonii.AAC.1
MDRPAALTCRIFRWRASPHRASSNTLTLAASPGWTSPRPAAARGAPAWWWPDATRAQDQVPI